MRTRGERLAKAEVDGEHRRRLQDMTADCVAALLGRDCAEPSAEELEPMVDTCADLARRILRLEP